MTVLFTDIVGFTGISERLSAEDLAKLLNDHFSILAEAIDSEAGTIDKYIGDSVMAFWGAPEDQADHAARACRAALQMARLVEAKGAVDLRLRIGLHCGPVIVGNIGAPGRINYTVVGDVVNSAQRLEGLGKEHDLGAPVTILCSEAVKEAAGPGFVFEPLGAAQLRGRAEKTAIYRLVKAD